MLYIITYILELCLFLIAGSYFGELRSHLLLMQIIWVYISQRYSLLIKMCPRNINIWLEKVILWMFTSSRKNLSRVQNIGITTVVVQLWTLSCSEFCNILHEMPTWTGCYLHWKSTAVYVCMWAVKMKVLVYLALLREHLVLWILCVITWNVMNIWILAVCL